MFNPLFNCRCHFCHCSDWINEAGKILKIILTRRVHREVTLISFILYGVDKIVSNINPSSLRFIRINFESLRSWNWPLFQEHIAKKCIFFHLAVLRFANTCVTDLHISFHWGGKKLRWKWNLCKSSTFVPFRKRKWKRSRGAQKVLFKISAVWTIRLL